MRFLGLMPSLSTPSFRGAYIVCLSVRLWYRLTAVNYWKDWALDIGQWLLTVAAATALKDILPDGNLVFPARPRAAKSWRSGGYIHIIGARWTYDRQTECISPEKKEKNSISRVLNLRRRAIFCGFIFLNI